MSPEVWERAKEVLDGARPLPPGEREGFVRRTCGGDAELLDLALELLRGFDSAGDEFLEPPPPPEALPPAPRVHGVLGEFELIEEIGRGGMGVVYRARQAALERVVAVKVLELGLTTSPRDVDRFLREARASAKLQHDGIVPVHSVGRVGNAHYFAMELVPRGDLAGELQRQAEGGEACYPRPGEPGHVRFAVERIAGVAEALQYAHGRGVVHRDIKPQNLLIGDDDELKLVDFGLAKDESQGSISRTGEVLGTPFYMSPEQARARREGIDHRTDVYSLGTVLYELLTLRKAVAGDSVDEVLSQILQREPVPLRKLNPAVPRDLELVCAKAMAKEPAERYATAGEFAADLHRLLQLEPIEARPPHPLRRLQRFLRRHRWRLAGAVAVLLALAAGWYVAGARAEREALGRSLRPVEEALALEPWDGHTAALVGARRAARELLAGGPLPRDALDTVRRFEERLAGHRARVLAETGPAEPGLVETPAGAYARAPTEREQLRALLQRGELSTLFWEDPELARLASVESLFPRLSLGLAGDEAAGARAALVPLDPIAGVPGQPEPLPAIPFAGLPVAPGFYRIRVEVPGLGTAELTRELRRGEDVELAARVLPDAAVQPGMVRIPAGVFELRRSSELGCVLGADRAELGAFWIDEAEVSNADYAAFLADTGHEPPVLWLENGYVDGWADLPLGERRDAFPELPVAGVSWYDARAFAEWAGKRLPTHLELERALRGEAGVFTPDAGRANVDGPWQSSWTSSAEKLELYLANVLPVRAPDYLQGPEGLYHGYGNVGEYTESPLVEPQRGRLTVFPWKRLYLGGAWDAKLWNSDLSTHPYTGLERAYATPALGFRCAKSAD